MVSVNILDQLMGRQREREWKSSSFLRYGEEVFVDKMVENEGENVSLAKQYKLESSLLVCCSLKWWHLGLRLGPDLLKLSPFLLMGMECIVSLHTYTW